VIPNLNSGIILTAKIIPQHALTLIKSDLKHMGFLKCEQLCRFDQSENGGVKTYL